MGNVMGTFFPTHMRNSHLIYSREAGFQLLPTLDEI